MALDITLCHLQCFRGDIDSIDLRMREIMRADNGDTATAGAEIEDRTHGIGFHPGRKLRLDEFSNRRARYQHAIVDIEWHAGKPGLTDQIRRRYPLFETGTQQIDNGMAFLERQRGIQISRWHIGGQMQRMHHQHGRLVDGIVGAVTERELVLVEATGTPADKIAHGGQNLQ